MKALLLLRRVRPAAVVGRAAGVEEGVQGVGEGDDLGRVDAFRVRAREPVRDQVRGPLRAGL